MSDLLDVNVLLALSVRRHVHHARALRYWTEERAGEVIVCTPALFGLLRMLTNGTVMEGAPLTPAAAWRHRARLLALASVRSEDPLLDPWPVLDQWVADGRVRAHDWTDAWLAALARVGGHRFVTFDRRAAELGAPAVLHLAV